MNIRIAGRAAESGRRVLAAQDPEGGRCRRPHASVGICIERDREAEGTAIAFPENPREAEARRDADDRIW